MIAGVTSPDPLHGHGLWSPKAYITERINDLLACVANKWECEDFLFMV